ncbi:MAG TPA: LapA family protein [Candidatus Paceibacterota bacterium]|nr:LapA family protein [Candidatus Paceibacterota bacterium]
MLFSFIIGIILGAIAVIFAFQNVAVVTVSFFTWQLTGSLAIVILGTLLCGIVLTLLFLLPSVIRDEFYLATIKRQKREAEDELARIKNSPAPASVSSTTAVVTP